MPKFGPPPPEDLFDSESNCIYCAAPTAWEAPRCPVCGQALWIKRREAEARSPAYWVLVELEIVLIFLCALLPLLLLVYVGTRVDLDNIFQLIPVYLGSVHLPPDEAAILFGLVPQGLFWLALLPAGLSVCIVLGLLSRWPPLYFGLVFLEGLRIIAALSKLVIVISSRLETLTPEMMSAFAVEPAGRWVDWMRAGIMVSDVVTVVLSGLSLVLLLRLYDHFTIQKQRLVLRLDDDVEGNEVSLWLHGRAYAQQKTWALAALHLHNSLMLKETPEAYLVLAVAYINLARFELAEKVLNNARRVSPGNSRVDDLMALLAEKQKG
jgi:tetratricopeptide (TPR) repeat protein